MVRTTLATQNYFSQTLKPWAKILAPQAVLRQGAANGFRFCSLMNKARSPGPNTPELSFSPTTSSFFPLTTDRARCLMDYSAGFVAAAGRVLQPAGLVVVGRLAVHPQRHRDRFRPSRSKGRLPWAAGSSASFARSARYREKQWGGSWFQ